MYNDITAIILAGGKSLRMGKNKALLIINGKTIIENLVVKLDKLFGEIIIISNSSSEFNTLGKNTYRDIYPQIGPIAGIHSGLLNSHTEKNFIVSCDMPLLDEKTIKYLAGRNFKGDALFFENKGEIQALCGMYKKKVYKTAENLLNSSDTTTKSNEKIKLRLKDLIMKIEYDIVDTAKLEFCDDNQFLNMNTPEEFKIIERIITAPQ